MNYHDRARADILSRKCYNFGTGNNPFRPKTEAELFDRIDHSLAQADEGMLIDADEAVDDVMSELGLK